MLLVVCLLATCLGLGRIDPLLGTLAAGILAPALARTSDAVRRLRQKGQHPGNAQKLAIFLGSLTLVLGVLAAVAGIACLAGFVGWLFGRLIGAAWDEPWLPVVAAVASGILGLPGGLTAAALIAQRWWPAPAGCDTAEPA
jgi:hypothetical protein